MHAERWLRIGELTHGEGGERYTRQICNLSTSLGAMASLFVTSDTQANR